MRNYEAVFVFRSEDELYNSGRQLIKEEFEKSGVNVLKEEDMGNRDLAYPVQKESTGHYYFYQAEIEPEKVIDITTSIKLFNQVLKYLFVRQ